MWFRCTHRAGTIWVGITSPCDISEISAHFHGLHMASRYHSIIQVSLTHQICSWTSKLTCHNRPRKRARTGHGAVPRGGRLRETYVPRVVLSAYWLSVG